MLRPLAVVLLALASIAAPACRRGGGNPGRYSIAVAAGGREAWDGAGGEARIARRILGVLWDPHRHPLLRARDVVSDLSARPTLRLFLEQADPGEGELRVRFESDDPSTRGIDAFVWAVDLAFKGPRIVETPRSSLPHTGRPLGWDRLTGLTLELADDARTAGPIGLAGPEATLRPARGPVAGERDLLDGLPASRQGRKRLARRLRSGPIVLPPRRPFDGRGSTVRFARTAEGETVPADIALWPDEELFAEADRIAAGRITLVGVTHDFPGGEIDWSFNAHARRPDLPYNRQWLHHLCRQRFWLVLAEAYRRSGDERYARAIRKQWISFVEREPPDEEPDPARRVAAWRSIVAAGRIKDTWPHVFAAVRASPSLSDDDLLLLARSWLDHGRFLARFRHRDPDNHMAVELRALAAAAAFVPESADSRAWAEQAAAGCLEAARSIFLADGLSRELSPAYHALSLRDLLAAVALLDDAGFATPARAAILDALVPPVRALAALLAPDGRPPALNDGGRGEVRDVFEQFERLRPGDESVRAALEGRPAPGPWVRLFDRAGLVVARGANTFAVLDLGPLGSDHVHQDFGNLVWFVGGRELLFDSGGGTYEEGPLRSYGADTLSHNTVVVDGMGQRRPRSPGRGSFSPSGARLVVHGDGFAASGRATMRYGRDDPRRPDREGSGPVVEHRRTVLGLRSGPLLVVDDLRPADDRPHSYEARFHLRTEGATRRPESGAVVARDESGAGLVLVPLGGAGLEVEVVRGRLHPTPAGFDLEGRFHQARPTDCVLVRRRGVGPARLVNLLAPLVNGDRAAPNVRRVEGGWLVSVAGTSLRVARTPSGSLVLERLDPASGRVLERAQGEAGR